MNVCETCDPEKNSRDGLCQVAAADDGLPVRCAGFWAEDKLHYFRVYLELFTTAMKDKWPHLVYLDLFAGPGLCRLRDTGQEVDGSPLIALKNPNPFTKYFFIDLNEAAIDALKTRVAHGNFSPNICYFSEDCNIAVDDIIKELPLNFLGVAFADQTSKQVYFGTIRRLTENRRIDLIINFPLFMSLARLFTLEYKKMPPSEMDLFLGGLEWRQIYEKYSYTPHVFYTEVLKLYQSKLAQLGYLRVWDTSLVPIHAGGRRRLYYLMFASKHPRGNQFWTITTKYPPDGQRGFPF